MSGTRREGVRHPVVPERVTLVTGAAGQLGRGIATALAERGSGLFLTDVDGAALERTAAELDARTRWLRTRVADVTSDEDVHALVAAAASAAGRISACVNNAGVEQPVGPTEQLDLAAARRQHDINVFGPLRLIKEIIPHFRAQGSGRIINIASGAGLSGTAYMASYNASKHAVIGLTRSVALELAGDGISVNAVCPGCVESSMMSRIEKDIGRASGVADDFVSVIPMRRYAEVDEIGELVAYLAMDAPAYITGSALVIDGGLNA